MQFFTKISIAASKNPIDYQSKIVSIGSCFAENIGEKLSYFQFQNTINPFGIIFNPVSIEKLIHRVIQKNKFSENDVFFHNERWHCFEVHSELSHPDKTVFLNQLNELLITFRTTISTASHFIMTLGTSWVYKNSETSEIVANCHKIPQKQFSKHILSSSETLKSLEKTVELVRKINPNCHFIFTISPVRHLKDGVLENQISKANLISSIYTLTKSSAQNLSYFPSYEIMMDELRDYRFYKPDMLHPNSTAVDYIWSRFVETTIDKSVIPTMNEVETIQKSVEHRSFNPESVSHKKFLKNLEGKIKRLQYIHPFIKFTTILS
jgi:hypothetical protein